MKNYLPFILLLTILIFLSCGKDERVSGPAIFNTWEEIEPDGILQYGGSTYKSLYILDDSTFQLKFRTWSDIIFQDDPCNFIYDYYVKGVCHTQGDEIRFTGCYSDSSFIQCISNCAGTLDFSSHYKYKLTADSLIFNPGQFWASRRDMIPK